MSTNQAAATSGLDEDHSLPHPAGWEVVRQLGHTRWERHVGVWRVRRTDDSGFGVLKVVRSVRSNVAGAGEWELRATAWLGGRVSGVPAVLAAGLAPARRWTGGRTYWVMEERFAPEEVIPLEEVAAGDAQPLSRGIVVSLGHGVASSLAAMHALGVVHGDVKPGNLLAGPGPAAILDFDTARSLPDTEAFSALGPSPWETVGERRFGTPMYMTPEMAVATQGVLSPAADVYSLGATLYPLLWGTRPYASHRVGAHRRRATVTQVIEATASEAVLPPTDESDPLWPLVSSMLSKAPGARPTMGEVARFLAEACGGIPMEGE